MNGRIQQRFNGSTTGQTIISNISPVGITEDNEDYLYLSDYLLGKITKWYKNGSFEDILLSNLSFPYLITIDQNRSIYIADSSADRILKIDSLTKNVSLVAGGNSSDLSWPEGVQVDKEGNIYIADTRNHRIIQWTPGAKSGSIIVGGNGGGSQSNQLYYPSDLDFDSQGNLYVVDNGNHRVQKIFNLNND